MKKVLVFLMIVTVGFLSCGKHQPKGTGTINFTVNGEDFVKKGFTDRDGWKITFKHLYINIVNPTAYTQDNSVPSVTLLGDFWTDLTKGGMDAKPIFIGVAKNIKPANYQSLKFQLRRKVSGKFKGYSIVMIGTAKKKNIKIPFKIKLNEEIDFDGKEGFVGDTIKGIVKNHGSTDVEMTFHLDHLFGDITADKKSHVRTGSVGFKFFKKYGTSTQVNVSQNDFKKDKKYPVFLKALWSLGHLGEGHCHYSNQSSKDFVK